MTPFEIAVIVLLIIIALGIGRAVAKIIASIFAVALVVGIVCAIIGLAGSAWLPVALIIAVPALAMTYFRDGRTKRDGISRWRSILRG
jgi:hypothetical protein